MESICPICKKPYDGVVCTQCTVTDLDVSGLMASEGLHVETIDKEDDGATAFLVDLVSNRKIPITTPRCKVGRDDLNDIVISGDQSISRFHFVITKENNQYLVQDGKSRHGTFLNGNQITVPEPIHDGDVLKVGVSLFWFVIEAVVAGADTEKKSPVDMEADEAELEFGAPEPSAYVSAKATQTNLPRAELSETGAFPALDMSMEPLHITAEAADARDAQAYNSSLLDSYKSSVQEFSPSPAEPLETKKEPSAQRESAKADDDDSHLPHSYRTAHDSVKVINSDDAGSDFGNLSFFEPLNDVANELGTDPLILKDEPEASEGAMAGQDAHAAAVQSSATQPLENEEAKADLAEPELASQAGHADTDQSSLAESFGSRESLGSSTLESLDSAPYNEAAEPIHNNFGNIFGALSQSTSQSQSTAASELVSHEQAPEEILAQESSAPTEVVEPVVAVAAEPSEPSEPSEPIDQPQYAAATFEPEAEAVEPKRPEAYGDADDTSSSTLDKLAEVVGEAGSPGAPIPSKEDLILAQMIKDAYINQIAESNPMSDRENGANDEESLASTKPTSNGAKSLMSTTKESLSGTVPDWCNRYFHGELTRLGKELTDLNEQVRHAQQKIKEVEGRVSLTKGLRNTLLTATGEELVEGCGRVLSLLGWRVKISEDDKHELRVETDEKHTCIARVVWTETQADRTHLGQLSISQTRYWCEQGIEPKGILIVSRTNENGPQILTASDQNSELADYASKKNVCLMTTLQLLAVFKDIALHDGSMDTARATIMASNGWLPGFNLEPGDNDKEEGSSNKLSSLLSA